MVPQAGNGGETKDNCGATLTTATACYSVHPNHLPVSTDCKLLTCAVIVSLGRESQNVCKELFNPETGRRLPPGQEMEKGTSAYRVGKSAGNDQHSQAEQEKCATHGWYHHYFWGRAPNSRGPHPPAQASGQRGGGSPPPHRPCETGQSGCTIHHSSQYARCVETCRQPAREALGGAHFA
eukprot:gene11921-biopygen15453